MKSDKPRCEIRMKNKWSYRIVDHGNVDATAI